MQRLVLGLTIFVIALLLAAVALGFAESTENHASGQRGLELHGRVGLVSVAGVLMADAIAILHLRRTRERVREAIRVRGLPSGLAGQADRIARQADPFLAWGATLVGGAGVLGIVAGRAGLGPLWHVGVAAAAVAFHLGTFAVVALLIAAQQRVWNVGLRVGQATPAVPSGRGDPA
jgi:hypothetical protein